MLWSYFLSGFIEFYSAVSEEKSKMYQSIRGKGGHIIFRSARKTRTCQRKLRPRFQSRSVEFPSAVSEENSKMFQQIRGQGSHLVFPIGPKNTNTNLVEDVEILLPGKFCWIPFSNFRGDVENVKVYTGQCAMTIAYLSLWLRWAKNLVKAHWRRIPASCKVLSNICLVV